MPIIVVGKERTLEAVAASVLTVRASRATHAATLAALKEANPGLDDAGLTPGTVVVVPAAPGMRSSVGRQPGAALALVAAQARAALDELSTVVDAIPDAPRAERDRVTKLLARADLKRAAGEDPALAARLSEIGEAARANAKDAARHAEVWRTSIEQWSTQLDELKRG